MVKTLTSHNKLSFEEAYEQLKNIVEQLQAENTTLEQTIVLYKDGKILSDHCNNLLGKAKFEIENIVKDVKEQVVESSD